MPDALAAHRLTRRQLLWGAGGAAALAATAGVAGVWRGDESLPRIPSFASRQSGPARAFRSRPDLRPPSVSGKAESAVQFTASDGLLFLGPGPVSLETGPSSAAGAPQYGPLIVDSDGDPVWFRPLPAGMEVTNFAVSRYRGEPVLTWWEGKIQTSGYGVGEGVIVDRSYKEVARVRGANGRSMDLHEFRLTPHGTALFTCYPETVQADLSSVGGPRRGQVLQSIIQEIDIASGRLLFEWRSLEHVSVSDSYHPWEESFDYLHPNSIDITRDGNLLMSGRNTWAVYKLDRRTGEVIWTLGGKRTQFRMGPGVQFAWQHDARQVSDRVLTLFDNGTDGPVKSELESRALLLRVDESRRTVELARAYTGAPTLLATAMGSVQIPPSGHVLVGWGTASYMTEFASDGRVVANASLPSGLYSYRALRYPWSSAPHHRPAIAAGDRDASTGRKLVYASWNGSTEVAAWRVNAGAAKDSVRPVGIARRRAFETIIPLHPAIRYASVTALGSSSQQLGRSVTVRV